jgi:hypothetical protein
LPGTDGQVLLPTFKRLGADTRVVMVSADSDERQNRAERVPGAEFITSPVHFEFSQRASSGSYFLPQN